MLCGVCGVFGVLSPTVCTLKHCSKYICSVCTHVSIPNYSGTVLTQITFGESIMMTKVKGQEEHGLRRSKFPGVFLKYTTSANQITFRATLFSLQVKQLILVVVVVCIVKYMYHSHPGGQPVV